ncbi:Sel1-like repeat-containing protein kinase family protein [Thiomicrorhabdus sp.]|uniref:Sel1-like repeat-containing protein kinase family protein n=1 Tax=Thiomicrorhabdus sp. TaxID=2039724 RepID=UPI003562338C
MSDEVSSILAQQPDLTKIKPLKTSRPVRFFNAVKHTDQGNIKQTIQVLDNLQNHYAIKRTKDLLQYLNAFSEFPNFNEIRKVGFHYLLFFDYVGKKTLARTYIKPFGLTEKTAKKLLKDLVNGLEKLHAVGFVHTSIQPDNIVMSDTSSYLIGFEHAIPSLTSYEAEVLPEDCRYCPPERLNGQCDEKGDIYQLGCTLFFALTGKHIYRLNKVNDPMDQMWAHTHHSIRKINRLPIFWRYLIVWMTDKNPSNRPSLPDLKMWLKDNTIPEWVRRKVFISSKAFPKDSMEALADEHYAYAIYRKASQMESGGYQASAFNLYENGAFKGFSLAEERLGVMYRDGRCVQRSYSMAAHLFHEAYKKGNPQAAFNLAKMYEVGTGLPQDLFKAFKLFNFSAQRGNLEAQYKLGLMYLNGLGVEQDKSAGFSWLIMADHYGNADARTTLIALKQVEK